MLGADCRRDSSVFHAVSSVIVGSLFAASAVIATVFG
jgi:hypothetical protein